MKTEPGASWIERVYTHFLGRDVCYVFSGGLLVYLFGEAFPPVHSIIPEEFDFEVLVFLVLSYFLGLVLNEILTKLLVGERCRLFSLGYSYPPGYRGNGGSALFYSQAYKFLHRNVLRLLERQIFLQHAASTIGISLSVGAIINLVLTWKRHSYDSIWVSFLSDFPHFGASISPPIFGWPRLRRPASPWRRTAWVGRQGER